MKAFQLWVGMLIGGVLVFSACRPKDADRSMLGRIEQLMAKQPDVALKWLKDSIQSDLLSGKNYADWCLLVTEAKEKSGQPHTADSLVRIACTYYEMNPEPDRSMLSFYYMGRVYQAWGDVLMAQHYYQKALDAGESSQDLARKVRICSQIGDLYAEQGEAEEAIKYIQMGLSWLNKTKDKVSQTKLLRDLGRIYREAGELDQATYYYKLATIRADAHTLPTVYSELGTVLTDAGQYDEAYSYLQKSLRGGALPDGPYATYLALGKLLAHTGKADSARYYLYRSMESPVPTVQTAACYQLVLMAREAQDWPAYTAMQEEYEQLCDSIRKLTYSSTVQRIQSLYNYQLNESEHQRLRQSTAQRNRYGIPLLVALLLTGFLSAYIWYRRRKEAEQAALLPPDLEQGEVETEADFKRSRMYAQMSDPKKRSHSSSEKEVYIDTLARIYPDLIRRVRQQHPAIKWHEITLCYYTRAGLGNQEMSNVLDCATNSICSKKTRLYEKIFHAKGTPEAFNQYIQSL